MAQSKKTGKTDTGKKTPRKPATKSTSRKPKKTVEASKVVPAKGKVPVGEAGTKKPVVPEKKAPGKIPLPPDPSYTETGNSGNLEQDKSHESMYSSPYPKMPEREIISEEGSQDKKTIKTDNTARSYIEASASAQKETKPDKSAAVEQPKALDPEENKEPAQEQDELLKLTDEQVNNSLLLECAWEVCNQVGGIYTVIQTKVPTARMKWGDNYILLGPYFANQAAAMFEYDPDLYNEEKIKEDRDPVKDVVRIMHSMGYDIHFGTWLIDGRPTAILFNPQSLLPKIHEHKYIFWEHHNISLPGGDNLIDQVISFGFMVYEFIKQLSYRENLDKQLIAHFHEWMAGIPIPELRRNNINAKLIFTTHATMLGRYLAMNDPQFYDHLPFYDWQAEANHFNIRPIVDIERAASHGAHIFSTVSDLTAHECEYLIGRKPECILPNGLNIKRFEVMHEFQQIHKQNKFMINEFVMGHFFHNYTFNLDNTLYFFTSGRYEYFNKGFDVTLDALAKLNWMMKEAGIDKTVVMFFITRAPYHSMNSSVLESKAKLEEIRRNCDDIQEVLSDKLFNEMLIKEDTNAMPNLNNLVDDYLALRLRRNLGSWRSDRMPAIVTHNLVDEHKDPIMNFLKSSNLLNYKEDKVKIVYHPDFVSTSNPLFRMDYLQFVRGCHLGVFPSYYEPWGYTPLECCASGLPSVTTDLSGFGSYVLKNVEDNEDKGLIVVNRKNKHPKESAEELAQKMFEFVKLERMERIALRNRIQENSPVFGWRVLQKYYEDAYAKALNL